MKSTIGRILRMMAAGMLCLPALAQAPRPDPAFDVFAFVRALDETGPKKLWPGFDPASWPVALYDGEKTILLRHPSPPPEFSPMPGRDGVLVMTGRYPAVTANSTREIGGVRTATVLATPGQNPAGTLLACVEEVFHVFWLARHPAFRPDEMARYAYPVKDPENLRRLLAEDEALARALEAGVDSDAAGWAAAALRIRRERTAGLEPDVRAYETALEMMEGTANYVARRAAMESPGRTAERLRAKRPAEGIRWRFYDSGAALCWLLDRLEPDWKVRSENRPDLAMVEILDAALAARRDLQPQEFAATDLTGFQDRAAAGTAELSGRQERLRQELMARPGSRIVLEAEAGAEPFRVERFDPINLMVLEAGEVAHAHFITLAGANGTVALTNPGFSRGSWGGTVAVTAPAGRHPLGEGIRRFSLVGIEGRPEIESGDGRILLTAPGVRIELRGADLRVEGETFHLTIPKESPTAPR